MENNFRTKNVARKEQIVVWVNGKSMDAYQGETVFSALIANGIKRIRKSPVHKEPRGGFCGMGVCFECLVTIDGIPNLRSCMHEVKDGMRIEIDDE